MAAHSTEINPKTLIFEDDGTFPNSKLPVLVYSSLLAETDDLAAEFERALLANGWFNSWRAGVFDYAHYHSTTHEALAVYRGRATLRLGGPAVGSEVDIAPGDLIVIPAGVAHQATTSSDDFKVVGAYPDGRHWDVLRGNAGERPTADQRIALLSIPVRDPFYGSHGPLTRLWNPDRSSSTSTVIKSNQKQT